MQNNQWETMGDQLPVRSPIKLKVNFSKENQFLHFSTFYWKKTFDVIFIWMCSCHDIHKKGQNKHYINIWWKVHSHHSPLTEVLTPHCQVDDIPCRAGSSSGTKCVLPLSSFPLQPLHKNNIVSPNKLDIWDIILSSSFFLVVSATGPEALLDTGWSDGANSEKSRWACQK